MVPSLGWIPPQKRKQGQPEIGLGPTWQRTVDFMLPEMGLSGGKAQLVAKDYDRLRNLMPQRGIVYSFWQSECAVPFLSYSFVPAKTGMSAKYKWPCLFSEQINREKDVIILLT